jgi:hypothetical protein
MRDAVGQFLAGEAAHWVRDADGVPVKPLLFPGSFNPFHAGHAGLLAAAEEVSERSGWLELAVRNADKPALDMDEVLERLAGLPEALPVVLTKAATFLEKSEVFPGAWFAMGYDTAVRLLDARYHADVEGMLERVLALECRFVVAGRLQKGVYSCLEHLMIAPRYRPLFLPISESLFRKDISSTQLRDEADR